MPEISRFLGSIIIMYYSAFFLSIGTIERGAIISVTEGQVRVRALPLGS